VSVPIVFILISEMFDEDGNYGTVSVDPIDIAALDVLRPGIEAWAASAQEWDAVEVVVSRVEWENFYSTRVDDHFRTAVTERVVAAVCPPVDVETLEVMFFFERREWKLKGCDRESAVCYVAQGWRAVDVPLRNAQRIEGGYAAVIVRWLAPDRHTPLPLIFPAQLVDEALIPEP